ncbi:hypothetical protein GCM10023086_39060 [Streptomyces venetus]|uniref:NACHT domain-containing protein n=1 Tax=Streptomyces venetus TaxID=1701086 RepID=A0ABP8G3C4_9ACTN
MNDADFRTPKKQHREPGAIHRTLRRTVGGVRNFLADTQERARRSYWSYRDRHYVRNWPQVIGRSTSGVLLLVLAMAFVAWMVWGIVELLSPAPRKPGPFEKGCTGHPLACSGLASGATTLFLFALTALLFLVVAYWPVKRKYLKTVRNNPHGVVPTAGRIFGEVVGRDALCHTILKEVTSKENPRPQLIMGGAGAGKTAVLLKLAEKLAKERYIPVPIRLREKQARETKDRENLDFEALGEQRFYEIIRTRSRIMPFTVDPKKLWQKLRNNGRIVVLADGLEELLISDGIGSGRDILIRDAVQRANEQNLPLVIASRPHDPIRGINASLIDLEPLNEEEALDYLRSSQDHSTEDEQRLKYVVRVARVVESPLYLQLMKELCDQGLTKHLRYREADTDLDTRSHEILTNQRLHLLKTWVHAVSDGMLYRHVQISTDVRRKVIDQISLLACIGLQRDSVVVEFRYLFEERPETREPLEDCTEVKDELKKLQTTSGIGRELATTLGAKLGLVEPYGDGLRFPHSIMQAYLGSRMMHIALSPDYIQDAMWKQVEGEKHLDVGNEFLLALSMYAYSHGTSFGATGERLEREKEALLRKLEPWYERLNFDEGFDTFEKAMRGADPSKVLEVFIHAFEIDSEMGGARFACIAERLVDWIKNKQSEEKIVTDQWTIGQAKLRLARSLATTLHNLEDSRAQYEGMRQRNEKAEVLEEGLRKGYEALNAIAGTDRSHGIRLAAVQEFADSGTKAISTLSKLDERRKEEKDSPGEWEEVARSWLLPMLFGSASVWHKQYKGENSQHSHNLEWVNEEFERVLHGAMGGASPEGEGGCLVKQVALAQGFKYAANRRRQHRHNTPECESYLISRANSLLRRTDFWFTQLTLIQALCLWHMPDADSEHPEPERLTYSQARSKVNAWLDTAGTEARSPLAVTNGRRVHHPFVTAGADMAVLALEHHAPERFLWIDEFGVVSRVGSESRHLDRMNTIDHLWIPPSAGWSLLDPRARKLVADVLLLLNLADRGDPPSSKDYETRLKQTGGTDLPSCLRGDRGWLDPCRPGSTEKLTLGRENCASGCPVQLCPYPSKSDKIHQSEMSEAFCRKQRELVAKHRFLNFRQTMWWQGASLPNMRSFWESMEDRAQGRRPRSR